MLIRMAALVAAIALLLAAGGYYFVSRGPPLVVVAHRVHDIDPKKPGPRLVLAVIFENKGDEAIAITDDLTLRVRSVNTGGEQRVRPQSDGPMRVASQERVELIYDLWQLTNLYDQGLFRELRDSPDDMRFLLEIETDAGLCRSDEWAGLTSGSDVGTLLLELRGGDGV